MRALVWVIGLSALAAGLVIAARYNTGYALLVSPPYRIELSLNLLAALALCAFFLGYVAVRLISGTIRLPARVQAYRVSRRRQKADALLAEALQEFFAGRYARAEKAAAESMKLGEAHAGVGALLAARSAHELRAHARRDQYLAQAAERIAETDVARVTTEADCLLVEHRYQDALEVLRRLPRRHTAALRLELRAQQALRNWSEVLHLIDELEKRGVFDPEQALQIRVRAQVENLKRKAMDAHTLGEAWQKVPARLKKDTRVAAAAAQGFIALAEHARAQEVIEQSLAESWDSALIVLYAECPNAEALRRIERAERWLEREPRDPALLLTLGKLCTRQGLWGKAQSYLEASIAIEPSWSAHYALAQLHEKLGNLESAHRHSSASLELAIAQLRQVTGGRRRTPL